MNMNNIFFCFKEIVTFSVSSFFVVFRRLSFYESNTRKRNSTQKNDFFWGLYGFLPINP